MTVCLPSRWRRVAIAGLFGALALDAVGAWSQATTRAEAVPIGDAVSGAELFTQECSQCHQIGEDAHNRIGPRLNEVFGRRAGAIEGYNYSTAMLRKGSSGLTWTLETLDAYLENPRALVSGTRMAYRGLSPEVARNDLLAFLRDWSDNPRDFPEAEPTARRTESDLPPEILAIEGDVAYGEYLASACTACHQRDGSDQGIPAISGWPEEDFVVAMHAYKSELRPHPVMQMMARRLSNEEIAALAAYFAQLQ